MRTYPARGAIGLALIALVLLTAGWLPGASATAPGSTDFGFLDDVSVISGTDVWAVGVGSETETETLVQHFDGATWQRVSSPSPGDYAELTGVDGVRHNDVWAGGYASADGKTQTCIEHWDGSRWRRVASPNPGGRDAALFGLTARTRSDAWAVGYSTRPKGAITSLVEHWDGASWQSVEDAVPQGSHQSALQDAAILASDDVWAVGYAYVGHPSRSVALAEHWNGHGWTVVTTPSIDGSVVLNSVTAVSPSDVWAVGRIDTDGGASSRPVTEHWNGRRWSVVASPNPRGDGNLLAGAAGVSGSDAWAVGLSGSSTLAEHWDGDRWRRVGTRDVGDLGSGLTATDAATSSDVWAVGFWAVTPANEKPLVEHWNGTRWSVSQR